MVNERLLMPQSQCFLSRDGCQEVEGSGGSGPSLVRIRQEGPRKDREWLVGHGMLKGDVSLSSHDKKSCT